MFPKAGSEQEFARHAFPNWVSTTVGWSMALALVVAASTVALGFSRYLAELIDVDFRLGAIVITLLMSFVSFLGMQRAIWLILSLGAIEVGGLVLVFVVGAPSIGDVDLFAFIGFDEVVTLSEETKNPRRTVPLALFLSLAISTLLYVGVAIVAVSVLGVRFEVCRFCPCWVLLQPFRWALTSNVTRHCSQSSSSPSASVSPSWVRESG